MHSNVYEKPDWLRKRITLSNLEEVKKILRKGKLHTVCEEAMCPNIGECFSRKQATFLILGNQCTRRCTFCSVSKEMPLPPDPDEPIHISESVAAMGLRHVVITSPTRDDLPDGGAEHFARVVKAIKAYDESIVVELLVPDFQENEASIERVAHCGAEIIGHNIETVPRLYHIRKGARYDRSLRVLRKLADSNEKIVTKSGIMLGLGEEKEEVLQVMEEILETGCRLLSIGQYLAPSKQHTPVVEYIPPQLFDEYRREGMAMGYRHIQSSPYTRSSYLAEEYLR